MTQILFASLISATGQLFLKTGIGRFPHFLKEGFNPKEIVQVLVSPIVFVGLLIFGFGTLVWLKVLSTHNLSAAYPILVASSFALISLFSSIFLHESITFYKLVGMIGIIAGISLIVRS